MKAVQILVSLSSFVCVFQIPVEDKAKRSKRMKFLAYSYLPRFALVLDAQTLDVRVEQCRR